MRRMSALLAQELLQWPDVSARPMFGLHAFYRGAVIFAMLPGTRAFERPNAIGYKPASGVKGEKWRLFELQDEGDIGKALAHVQKAYATAIPEKLR